MSASDPREVGRRTGGSPGHRHAKEGTKSFMAAEHPNALSEYNDAYSSNGRRHVDEWLPLKEWSVREVWARIARAGTRVSPVYSWGMPRLSCSFCVLSSKAALVRAARLRPGLAGEYASVEEEIGHDFRLGLPIAEIVGLAEAEASAGIELAGEVEGWAA